MQSVISSVLPIVLLLVLGWVLRVAKALDDDAAHSLKGLAFSVVLPAILFNAFLTISFEAQYLALVALLIGVCVAMLMLGSLARRWLAHSSDITPFLFTGFAFGMIGLPLYMAAYGAENVGIVGIVGLSNELFVWLLFVPLLQRTTGGTSWRRTLRGFVTSPVILAIGLGLLLNVTGVGQWLARQAIGAALLSTADFVAALSVPLILIIVGHGTRLDRDGVRAAAPLVAARMAVLIALALAINAVVVRGWLGLSPLFEAAVFTMLILPPAFIVPLFLPRERSADMTYANNVLSLHTVASVAVFIGYVAITT